MAEASTGDVEALASSSSCAGPSGTVSGSNNSIVPGTMVDSTASVIDGGYSLNETLDGLARAVLINTRSAAAASCAAGGGGAHTAMPIIASIQKGN
jgi:hypothetical protein